MPENAPCDARTASSHPRGGGNSTESGLITKPHGPHVPPSPGKESPKTRKSSTDHQRPQLRPSDGEVPGLRPWGLGSVLAAKPGGQRRLLFAP